MGEAHEIIRAFPNGYSLHAELAKRDGEQVIAIQWKKGGKERKQKPCAQELRIPTDIAVEVLAMLGQFAASVSRHDQIPF
jgi:hypothetical protein